MFTNYMDVQDFLNNLGLFHMDLSLVRVQRALQTLGLTHPPFTVVQVVGTNGKGSTSTFLHALGMAHCVRTGLFTSPHFVSPTERIVCHDCLLSQEQWPALAQKVYNAEKYLTYFEFLTVLALLAFAENGMELVIMEAGLGGRFDATTAVQRHVLCLTPISLDHTHILGTTEEAIATDKCGAMSANMPVVCAPQQPSVKIVIENAAKACNAPLLHTDDVQYAQDRAWIQKMPLGLWGVHQEENAHTALCAWHLAARHMEQKTSLACVQHGLSTAFIPGRLQYISTDNPALPSHCLLDGAHNTHGLQCLIRALETYDIRPSAMIFSCLADKDLTHILPLMGKVGAHCPVIIPPIAHNERAAPCDFLKQELQHFIQHTDVYTTQNFEEALTLAKHISPHNIHDSANPIKPVLICGSLYLLAEFFEKYPMYLRTTKPCLIHAKQ